MKYNNIFVILFLVFVFGSLNAQSDWNEIGHWGISGTDGLNRGNSGEGPYQIPLAASKIKIKLDGN